MSYRYGVWAATGDLLDLVVEAVTWRSRHAPAPNHQCTLCGHIGTKGFMHSTRKRKSPIICESLGACEGRQQRNARLAMTASRRLADERTIERAARIPAPPPERWVINPNAVRTGG